MTVSWVDVEDNRLKSPKSATFWLLRKLLWKSGWPMALPRPLVMQHHGKRNVRLSLKLETTPLHRLR